MFYSMKKKREGTTGFIDLILCSSIFLLQYYAHRAKLRVIGKEDILETLNRTALKVARQVADENNVLMAGNICNTAIYEPTEEAKQKCYEIFKVGTIE